MGESNMNDASVQLSHSVPDKLWNLPTEAEDARG